MQENKSHYTLEELAELVDIPVRTIRYYITEGLLPGPEGRGKATTYSTEHYQRLRLIRLLSQQRMPLAEMVQLLASLSLTEIQALVVEEEQRASTLERMNKNARSQDYIATLLQHAQASRQKHQPFPGSPAPASRQVDALASPAAPAPARAISEAVAPYQTTGERWQRLLLASGLELHIQESKEEEHRDLIQAICKLAGHSSSNLCE